MAEISRESIKQWAKTYCPYCGVGCGLLAGIHDNAVAKIKGDPDHPSSRGDLCLKAVYLPEVVRTEDRLLYPQVRHCQDAPFKRASWSEAMAYVGKRFHSIIDEHGPDAVAFYGSGQLTTEEYYVANKLAKGFLGTNNFDTNSRLAWPRRWPAIKVRSALMVRQPPTRTSKKPTASFSSEPIRPIVTR